MKKIAINFNMTYNKYIEAKKIVSDYDKYVQDIRTHRAYNKHNCKTEKEHLWLTRIKLSRLIIETEKTAEKYPDLKDFVFSSYYCSINNYKYTIIRLMKSIYKK